MKTPYVYVIDDDVLPSANWIETCMSTSLTNNCIVASSGRIIPNNDYSPEIVKGWVHYFNTFIGDSDNLYGKNYCPDDTFIDFGCNSWFFKAEWLYHFWSIRPFLYSNGEDIHLSASCFIKGGIKTICPLQDGKENSGNVKKFYGWDQVASH